MHELSICLSLIDAVVKVAAENHAASISDIHVSVGPLSGVEAALLINAFPIAAAGTAAEDAELHVHDQPVKVRCESCGAETEATANRLTCGKCQNWRTSLLSGDGLLLQRVCMTKNTSEVLDHV
jgi:hydrogenase nickel incorporation protein HypA/HybF